jgi:hypothetical protein
MYNGVIIMPKRKGKKRGGKLRKDEFVETNIMSSEARIKRRKKFKLL